MNTDSLKQKLPKIILCGYERGGTTLLSEIFRNNGYQSGFECGVLLAQSPCEFKEVRPFYERILNDWQISKHQLEYAINGNFEHFYDSLISNSPLTQTATKFFDKTPKYMECLGNCLIKTDFIEKAVVIHRDPRSVFCSWAKRESKNESLESVIDEHFENWVARYISYFLGCISHIHNKNVMFLPFEELVSRELTTLQTLGYFCEGKAFLPRTLDPQFGNVTSKNADLKTLDEYEFLLSKHIQNKILDATRFASLFFANVSERVRYGDMWEDTYTQANQLISDLEWNNFDVFVDGVYFEPLTYLLRYQDVLKAKESPVEHFSAYGHHEGRNPC